MRHRPIRRSEETSQPDGRGLVVRPHQPAAERQASLLDLQQTYGNQAVLHMLGRNGAQAKLRLGAPNDRFEQEADHVAKSVVSGRLDGSMPASLSQGPAGQVRRKCAECEEEEETIRRAPKATTTASTAASPGSTSEGSSEPATAETSREPTRTLLAEDSAEELAPGQMRKSEFLSKLRSVVCRTVDEGAAGAGQTSDGCPWIQRWFDLYATKPASHVERAIQKFAPETKSAATAQDYISSVNTRVRQSVEIWAATGEVTGLPEGVPRGRGGVSVAATGLIPAASRIFFKGWEGGPRDTEDAGQVRSQLGHGRSLDSSVRSRMESAFGLSFSGVRVHTDASAGQLSDHLNARAFTVGRHVAFAPGEYRPGTPVGDALIAHELAHVVQQGGAESASGPLRKGPGETGALEEDADRSAVGAVASLWAGAKGGVKDIGRRLAPSLRSGLRLSRCPSPRVDLVKLHKIELKKDHIRKGYLTGGGAVAEMKVAEIANGEKVFERLSSGNNSCPRAQNLPACSFEGQGKEPFEVGREGLAPILNVRLHKDLEGKHKTFYDKHFRLLPFSILHKHGKDSCDLVCNQTYEYENEQVGSFEIVYTVTRDTRRIDGKDINVSVITLKKKKKKKV